MISIQRLNARGQNKNGDQVVDYLMACEYYLNAKGQKEENTRWGGQLASDPDLDLAGKRVEKADMLQLAQGFSPSGEALCQNAGDMPRETVKMGRNGKPKLDKDGNEITKQEGGHRVGFDLTFSAPKPFSVAFAIAEGDERDKILDAHRRAVAVGMRYLEDQVETRRGKNGKDVIGTKGLIYMQADHLSSRNLDVNLHTHNLCFGVAKGEDGKWGTYDSQELYRHRVSADAVYKNELAMNMRELGYSIEQERQLNDDGKETGRVLYKVVGISDELCETFSSRRQEILDYQEKFGVDAQTACLATRRHKDEPSYSEMSDIWKKTMEAMPDGQVPTIEQLKSKTDVLMATKTNEEILEKLHENNAVVCQHHLIDVIGQEHAGQIRYTDLLKKVDEFKSSTGMVAIEGERMADEDKGASLSRRNTETRYAAPWMLEWENEVVHRVESRKNEDHQKVPKEVVDKAVDDYQQRKGFTLSSEQRKAVEHLTGPGGVAILEGFAGTGKTSVSQCYSEAFKAQGKRMLGVCVSNDAAKLLQNESGMPCVSVSMMLARLDRGKMTLTDNDVLVVDEAGMIDTSQTRQLLSWADKAGSKVILQGDTSQLQPIGAGSGMSLAKTAVDGVKLTEIRRQKNQDDRDIALMFYNRNDDGEFADLKKGTRSKRETNEIGGKILAALDKKGAIDDYDNQKQAIDALVDDYLKHPAPPSEKLVLGHMKVEVALLNEGIRAGLKEQGLLDKNDTIIRAKENGQTVDLPMAKGDRIRFTDGNRTLGVVNGSKGILIDCQANAKGGVDLKVQIQSPIEAENGRVVAFNTKDFSSLGHNFATTVHKSQGASKEEIFHLASSGMMDNHSSLVAFSRLTKGEYRLYGTTDDIETLKERFGLERLKETARDAGIKNKNEAEAIIEAHTKRSAQESKKAEKSALSSDELDLVAGAAQRFNARLGGEQRRDRGHDRGAEM